MREEAKERKLKRRKLKRRKRIGRGTVFIKQNFLLNQLTSRRMRIYLKSFPFDENGRSALHIRLIKSLIFDVI